MKERLENVIRRIILPQHPEILNMEIQVKKIRRPSYINMNEKTKYYVYYLVHDEMERDEINYLKDETESLFEMLNPTEDELIDVRLM